MGLLDKFRNKSKQNLKYDPKMQENMVKDSPFLKKLTIEDFKEYIEKHQAGARTLKKNHETHTDDGYQKIQMTTTEKDQLQSQLKLIP